MTLDEFKTKTLQSLESFVQKWQEESEREGSKLGEYIYWPLEMEEGDWFEHFILSLEKTDESL